MGLRIAEAQFARQRTFAPGTDRTARTPPRSAQVHPFVTAGVEAPRPSDGLYYRSAQRALDVACEDFGLGLGKRAINRAPLLIKSGELGSERIALQHGVLEHDAILARKVGFGSCAIFLFSGL